MRCKRTRRTCKREKKVSHKEEYDNGDRKNIKKQNKNFNDNKQMEEDIKRRRREN